VVQPRFLDLVVRRLNGNLRCWGSNLWDIGIQPRFLDIGRLNGKLWCWGPNDMVVQSFLGLTFCMLNGNLWCRGPDIWRKRLARGHTLTRRRRQTFKVWHILTVSIVIGIRIGKFGQSDIVF
jgi:hypothetical protein